tara:strand:- start:2515 stop:2631 length:117 start_codon:yes stop_codon:yes gene_type:complete
MVLDVQVEPLIWGRTLPVLGERNLEGSIGTKITLNFFR